MKMIDDIKRRKFIQTSGSMAMGLMGIPAMMQADTKNPPLSQEVDIKSSFPSNREDALLIAERVMEKCVLNGNCYSWFLQWRHPTRPVGNLRL